ncbi:MAG: hypothetical protein ACE5NL_00425 [Candidatus Hydrothermarchaeaceae archaeon]
MAEKIMVCGDCGKIFRVKFLSTEKIICPSCDSPSVDGIYSQYNLEERK